MKTIQVTLLGALLLTAAAVAGLGCVEVEPAERMSYCFADVGLNPPHPSPTQTVARPYPVEPAIPRDAMDDAVVLRETPEAARFVVVQAETAPATGPASQPASRRAVPRAVNRLVLPNEDTSPFLTEENFVTFWNVLGPFPFEGQNLGGDQYQGAADKEFVPREGELTAERRAPEGTKWQQMRFQGGLQAGQVDLDKLYNQVDYAAAYLVTYLESPEALENAKIYVGSDDYIKVWVNGRLVHTYKTERRGSDWDQDTIEHVALNKGMNHVVVKVVDVVSGFDFYFRLTDAEDMPLGVQPVMPASAPASDTAPAAPAPAAE